MIRLSNSHPHINRPEDRMIMKCTNCGWKSSELSMTQVHALGIPWSCQGACGRSGVPWVRYHPSERDKALAIMEVGK